ncbi:conserved hypothetical protein [Afipia carboxidovorans OM5]|uniref:Hemin uptake protein HemP n=1 Tax=Afipia carboxidovorans (strain ATCC 49405 / DSM 1227 / KCTC 32145 / OM5) TaxID=504832 RepID=B6JAV2_AFIC5|nr:hemin uptake protein HemP [Afipia carboxidovorans]ACI92026.1 conserved hypothetical protein [Afipia carboxidovorans OM5]AEI04116.1 hypothetical protein OCA4_c30100 [Afipia carboxidovorans OM4]AEI07746.1 hypothetical protein OCA5_c30620 [Afipia carboxidovorans OM5]BEV45270.1 hypothetical protein CRBSH125_14530 [Afipia carboxidovorans]
MKKAPTKLMNDTTDQTPRPSVDTSTRQVLINGNRMDSADLFRSARELLISHGEETYRLRLTSQNKLILTK